MLTIDGARGEGGGQILRTSLALSIRTRTPFRIHRIRAGREKPGLLRQHLTAVRAAAEICGATVSGDSLGSQQLTFEPGPLRHGEYEFSVGTAGSATLVLQTVHPPLLTAEGPSRLTLEGGTHNPSAPPFEFLARAFLPLVGRTGPRIDVELARAGFYPNGGGRADVRIEPAERLAPLHLTERGAILRRRCEAVVARLPFSIAEREVAAAKAALGWPDECFAAAEWTADQGPGNIVLAEVESEHVTEVFAGFGRRGVPAEQVAAEVAAAASAYLAAGVPVGEHLADQLLLPLALAGGGSFATPPLSEHARTNIETIRLFLDVEITAREREDGSWLVAIGS